MSDLLIPAALAFGGAYVVLKSEGGPAPAPTELAPNGGAQVGAGGQPGATVGQQIATGSTTTVGKALRPGGAVASLRSSGAVKIAPVMVVVASAPNWGGASSADQGQVLALAQDACHSTYDQMSDAAKQQAIDYLNNKLDLNPALTLASSWDDIAKAAAYAGGSAAGTAIGTAIGGPVGAQIGSLCGAYLGVQIEDFLSRSYPECKAWVDAKWSYVEGWINSHGGSEIAAAADWVYDSASGVVGDVTGAVSGAASDVEDAASDAVNYIGGLF